MTGQSKTDLDTIPTIEIARVTEHAAIAAALLRGRGDELAADTAGIDAMHGELDRLPIKGHVVVGEGERDDVPALFTGQTVGSGKGPRVDIGLDPLEGATSCAKDQPNAMAVIAVSEKDGLLALPDIYMDKIAIGPGYSDGLADLDRPVADVIADLARQRGVAPQDIRTCVMDRPRHGALIEKVRQTGASVRLISDGDLAAIIHTTDPEETGIDIFLGVGGAPEGVLAAAALRCTGGQMQGRLVCRDRADHKLIEAMGFADIEQTFTIKDMVPGSVIFSATGVTAGHLLKGVRFAKDRIETETLVMRSSNGTIRRIGTTLPPKTAPAGTLT